mmetsp:Transcript_36079/g.55399  ORF Transcript_36079/g.55399 Transcript_36079/m.55399 type:complete len:152 (+) Transcript_36079:10-465(+)
MERLFLLACWAILAFSSQIPTLSADLASGLNSAEPPQTERPRRRKRKATDQQLTPEEIDEIMKKSKMGFHQKKQEILEKDQVQDPVSRLVDQGKEQLEGIFDSDAWLSGIDSWKQESWSHIGGEWVEHFNDGKLMTKMASDPNSDYNKAFG